MKKPLKMNIALFTSNHLRHKYVASKLAEDLCLKLIVSEEKSSAIQDTTLYNKTDKRIIDLHFKERQKSEQEFFGNYKFPTHVNLKEVQFNTINSDEVIEALNSHKIDVILLFGSSIVKDVILDKYLNNVINLHLGLSPYYKGSGTNFFPVVNNEFECLGATFHLATNKVDAGNILHQIRVDNIEENDTIYSLGNKVIFKAGKLYPKIVKKYLHSTIKPVPQNNHANNKEYRIKDFTPETIKKANEVILKGGIAIYLANRNEIDSRKPIISNYNE